MVVDDDDGVRTVLTELLAEEGYEVSSSGDAQSALDAAQASPPDLVLADLKMPGKDGLWLLRQLKEKVPQTAVVMLTGYGDTETAVECLQQGAEDYLLKPPRVLELVQALERAVGKRRAALAKEQYQRELEERVKEATAELSKALVQIAEAYNSTLYALVSALDAREQETAGHSQRVVRYTLAIARRLGISGRELEDIGRGALLHDVGKIGVSDGVLLKAGPLTPLEWEEMRTHPEVGFQIMGTIPFLKKPSEVVLAHQERWDGGGYPKGLKGEEIPLGARIFSVADAFDAILSDRPYRKGASIEVAREEIARCSGTQFDPVAVDAFLSIPVDELMALVKAEVELGPEITVQVESVESGLDQDEEHSEVQAAKPA